MYIVQEINDEFLYVKFKLQIHHSLCRFLVPREKPITTNGRVFQLQTLIYFTVIVTHGTQATAET